MSLSATWGPLSESLLSLRLLRQRRPNPLVDDWKRAVPGQLDRWIEPLLVLAPTSPLIDLHTLVGESSDMDQALESLAAATARPTARSLILVPSVFCLDGPLLLTGSADRTSPHVLVYPALRGIRDATTLWAPQTPPEPAALARLLGTTRADALHAISSTCTTSDLARRLRVSPTTASHHVGVLRDARLVTSCRQGAAVDHRLTPLGAALLPDLAG